MEVCLINPRDTALADPIWDQPLGLMYLGAVLEQHEIPVSIFDTNLYDDWEKRLPEASWYGVYCNSSMFNSVVDLSNFLDYKQPDALKMVGGPHATCMPHQLTPFFHKVVIGEGEKAIIEILQGKWIGKLVHCPPIEDLDTIPFPARHLIPTEKYHRTVGGEPSAHIITSRGCPFSCAFCSVVWPKQVRFRSAQNVLAEVQQVIKQYGITAFMVFDETFTLNKKRLSKILDGFKRLHIKWQCLTRVDQVNRQILEKMKRSGCVQVFYGIESGSQIILDNLGKGTTVEQNAKAIDMTKQVGIPVKASVIVGSPGESWTTVNETIKLIEEHTPDTGHVCIFTPFPGSPAWNNPEDLGIKILNRNVSEYQFLAPVKAMIRTEHMSPEEIEKAHAMVLAKFRELGLTADS